MHNFLHIEETKLDEPIYRIFSVERFLQLLSSGKLTLVKPHMWDDPFENLLLTSKFITASNEEASFETQNSVYGQCWTLHAETDAMWRIYSLHKNGVRVKTTPRKLLTALHHNIPMHPELSGFIGKVQYAKDELILKENLEKINLMKADGTGLAESLLYKRHEFSHEQEVRLIYLGKDGACVDDIFNFLINSNELFENIMFDPRMDKSLQQTYQKCIETLGCKVKVECSTLYDLPKDFTFNLK